ncbi:MAG: anthranilate phosphoribosyltransferase [Phycisphaerales bacterium]|nr:anthranilate phosphoribosyltransferase [Phycisphaerales bacterium]
MQDTLRQLVAGKALTEAQAELAFEHVLAGHATEAQVSALLALLARNGVSVPELVGAARSMRRHVMRVPIDAAKLDGHIVDTCGTGGAPKTFNISTAAAIIAAAARGPAGERVYVAKHGNRSRTGRGSAEVLMQLGINVDATPETQAKCLREAGLCFCFAIHHHPAMRHAAGPRKSLGFPTIFNLLGPLTNPAGAGRQLLGVYDRSFVRLMAETLAILGAERAMVAHGMDGLDEITTTAPTVIAEVRAGAVEESMFDAASTGVPRATLEALRVETLDDAGRLIRAILAGAGPEEPTNIALVNAAAALVVGEVCPDMASALRAASEAITSGAAERTLDALGKASAE